MSLKKTTKKAKTGDSDPKPHDRVWVQHKRSGKVGYLIERDGVVKVRLDRPTDPYAIESYNDKLWVEMKDDDLKMPRALLGEMQWAADRALLGGLGFRIERKKDFFSIPDSRRIEFMDDGPQPVQGAGKYMELRRKVFLYIKEAMAGVAEGT